MEPNDCYWCGRTAQSIWSCTEDNRVMCTNDTCCAVGPRSTTKTGAIQLWNSLKPPELTEEHLICELNQAQDRYKKYVHSYGHENCECADCIAMNKINAVKYAISKIEFSIRMVYDEIYHNDSNTAYILEQALEMITAKE